jgi:hypothetical protein
MDWKSCSETERLVRAVPCGGPDRRHLVLTMDCESLIETGAPPVRATTAPVDQGCRSWFEPVRMAHTSLFGEPASSGMKTGAMRIAGIVNGSIGGKASEPRY